MKLSATSLGAGLILATASLAWAAPKLAVDQVIAAERAFAADAQKLGVAPSFAVWAAPDGIVLDPDPTNARQRYAGGAGAPNTPALKWRPLRVGVSRSGDLGYDVGPWTLGEGADQARGWFFTVWKRQPDGGWQWVFDHGTENGAPVPRGLASVVTLFPAPSLGADSATSALSQVQVEEARLASDMAAGRTAAGSAARLSATAWIIALQPDPLTNPADVRAGLLRLPPVMIAQPLGGGASDAGDVVYTYGKIAWTAHGKPAEGRYVRVWQRDHGAWRIVFAEMTPL